MNDADNKSFNAKSSVGIIILAAGASTRLNTPKQLLDFRGQTLLRRAVGAACESVCRPIVVVIGANADKVRREVEDLNVSIVENLFWTEGMSSSIRVGINALEVDTNNRVDAALLMLCDQPFVSSKSINRLVAAFDETAAKLIVSEYDATRGVPALFSCALFPELSTLKGAGGAKQIINRYLSDAACISIPEAALDIDTPQDLQRLNS
ncbi:MAG: hypothetical protein NVSMB56_17840 [Pyrinomonadaceae bacterium]